MHAVLAISSMSCFLPWKYVVEKSRPLMTSQNVVTMSKTFQSCKIYKLLGTCSYGWFVIVDTCSDIHCFYMFRYCFLLNPISTKMIQLLSSWVPHFSYKNCVLSLPPDSPECVVMFFDYESGIHRNHVFCKSGGLVEQAITALFSHALHKWLCWSTYKARILQNI